MTLSRTLSLLGTLGMILVGTAAQEAKASSPVHPQEIQRFHKVNDQLYRGSQPDPSDLAELQKLGIRTVISLINKPKYLIAWEREITEGLGMKFISIPLNAYTVPSNRKLIAILTEMLRPENHPVYIHCRQGKDRTGLAVGLYRVYHDGWDPHVAYNEMRKIGFNQWLLGLNFAYWKNARHFRRMNDLQLVDPALEF